MNGCAAAEVLRDAGYTVSIICPTGRGCEEKFAAIDQCQPGFGGSKGLLFGVGAIAAALLLRGVRPSAPAAARVGVRSQPMGASVLLGGREAGVVTNGELVVPSPVPPQVVLTFRKSGHRDETRTVRLPLPESPHA